MSISRRNLLKTVAVGTMLPFLGRHSVAAAPQSIRIVSRMLEVKGKPAKVYGILGPDGKPGIVRRFGEQFSYRVLNETPEATVIHWHGLTPPVAQDGVAMLSQPLIPAGGGYDYDFPISRAGTHWMHSHVGLQEQQLMAAPLIVHETDEPLFDTQEHVVLLHDFTFRDPAEILAELKSGGGAHAHHMNHDMSGMDATQMAMMMPGMLNDVTYDAYLANDRSLDDPEVVKVEKGGRLRLRIINGCAASNMWVDLGTLTGELVAVDGNAVLPIKGNRFPLAIAQRADIRIVVPSEGGAFPVLFQSEGVKTRTGLVLATTGAPITKVAEEGDIAPALDMALESALRPVGQLPDRPIARIEKLALTGGGADYVWGLNGKSSMHDTLFTVKPGERIEVKMVNETGMAHPMHLHGHYFKVVAIDDTRIDGALRDTVLVLPGKSVSILFDADNPGTWAFHCHHAYHMNSGMMGALAYDTGA